jgi:hypothetical protein
LSNSKIKDVFEWRGISRQNDVHFNDAIPGPQVITDSQRMTAPGIGAFTVISGPKMAQGKLHQRTPHGNQAPTAGVGVT